jgi:hypothetical protein
MLQDTKEGNLFLGFGRYNARRSTICLASAMQENGSSPIALYATSFVAFALY